MRVNQNEKRVFIALIVVLSIITIANGLYRYHRHKQIMNVTANKVEFENLLAFLKKDSIQQNQVSLPKVDIEDLDLNIASKAELTAAHIPEWKQKLIQRFRESGGVFPEELSYKQNLLVLHEYTKTKPYKTSKKTYKPYTKKPKEIIELNTADTLDLQKLYGIGKVLANRIVKYRDKIGGFYTLKQLLEVYGVKDSVLIWNNEQIILDSFQLQQININIATRKQLAHHPYISWKLATVLENYREMHGDFKDVSDLKKIVLLPDSVFEKLKPYISIN